MLTLTHITHMRQTLFLLLFLAAFLHHYSFGQSTDSTRKTGFFSGSVSVTNNGISVIPTFSLGKPATIITLSTGKDRFSFDPELRFSLEAKPWSFIFWWRYKLVRSPKFLLNIGVHPALNFRSELLQINGVYRETMVSRRYFAGELAPSYQVGNNIRVGMYYLHSRGLDHGTTGVTNFITLNSQFSAIRLSKEYFIRFTPQVYYLQMDQQDGYYVTGALTLAKRNFPISVSSMFNKTIQTSITASKDLVWNVSLTYSFHKKFLKQSD